MKPKSPTLVDKVYDKIKEEILANRLHPGEPLLEEELATSLGASRTPIRDAVRRLNHEGLVRIVPNKGAFVRVLTPKDIREIYEVREALESYAAGRAAVNFGKKELQALSALVHGLKRRRSQLGHKDLRDAWETMRQMTIASTDNDRMRTILTTMNDQVETARRYSSAPPGRVEALLTDFLSVVRALQSRNGFKAEVALRDHLEKSKNVLLEIFGTREGVPRDPTITFKGVGSSPVGSKKRISS